MKNYHSFIQSVSQSFIQSVIHSHSFIQAVIHSSSQSFIHSFSHSFIQSVIHSFSHSFIQSVIQSFIQSFIHSVSHSFSHSLIQSCIHSVIHSFLHTLCLIFFYLPTGMYTSQVDELWSTTWPVTDLPFFPLAARLAMTPARSNQFWDPNRPWAVGGCFS